MASCNNTGSGPTTRPGAARIVCSFTPMYIFTLNVVGSEPGLIVELLASPSQGCLHDYDPTVADELKLSKADALIVQGGIDEMIAARAARADRTMAVIRAGAGCARLASHDPHEHADGHHHDDEFNPHAWVSPKEAATQVRAIGDGLAAAFPAHAPALRANAQTYAATLDALAAEMATVASALARRTVVCGHDVFDYLARDLSLNIVDYVEEIAGTESSAAHRKSLEDKIRTKAVAAILIEPGTPRSLIDSLAVDTNVKVVVIDPVAGGTAPPTADDYVKTQRRNIDTLRAALGK